MCIRDRDKVAARITELDPNAEMALERALERRDFGAAIRELCLLYTSDAADERSSVDLGGRRIIKKKKK